MKIDLHVLAPIKQIHVHFLNLSVGLNISIPKVPNSTYTTAWNLYFIYMAKMCKLQGLLYEKIHKWISYVALGPGPRILFYVTSPKSPYSKVWNTSVIALFWLGVFIYFMYESVLPTHMCVHHMSAWCLQRSESIRSQELDL